MALTLTLTSEQYGTFELLREFQERRVYCVKSLLCQEPLKVQMCAEIYLTRGAEL